MHTHLCSRMAQLVCLLPFDLSSMSNSTRCLPSSVGVWGLQATTRQQGLIGVVDKNKTMHTIQAFITSCLRWWWSNKISNKEQWLQVSREPVQRLIRRRKWGWLSHILSEAAATVTSQTLTWNLEGKQKRGRPKNSWRQDTEAERKGKIAQSIAGWRRVGDGLCGVMSCGVRDLSK